VNIEKKHTLDSSKLIEICNGETHDDNTADTYQIAIALNEGKNKVLNMSKNFQLLNVNTDLLKF
jgi:hypothetical protein